FKTRRAGKLSGGMKQKLALCCALIHRPTVLFLDEPTTGVDTVSRKEFWEMLQRLKLEGITVLVSTPYMDEATLCERIALMQNGRILSINTPENIVDEFPKKLFAIKAGNMSALLHNLRQLELIESCFAFGEYHHITFKDDKQTHNETLLLQALQIGGQYQDLELKNIRAGIEDCFIKLMN
ncbi:MAG: ATP-binding cassette domain-containing protein, partial [Bacteroidota bacterium]